jgi:hypothetical protein
MAKVPLAGTEYIPGVTEEKALGEIKTLLDRYLDTPVDQQHPSPAAVAAQNGEATA